MKTIKELQDIMVAFRKERGWEKQDSPKDLSISITLEASEVMEHFQWKTTKEVEEYLKDAKNKEEVADEIADVFAYMLSMCHILDIDLSEAFQKKIKKSAIKYPAKDVKDVMMDVQSKKRFSKNIKN